MAAKKKKPPPQPDPQPGTTDVAPRKPTALEIDSAARNLRGYLLYNLNDLAVASPPQLGDADRRINYAMTFVNAIRLEANRSPRILTTNPSSVFRALIHCMQIGLVPDSERGEMYLIPYGKELKPQIGYKGLSKLALQATIQNERIVERIDSDCVYKGEGKLKGWSDELQRVKMGFDWDIVESPENVIGAFCQVIARGPGSPVMVYEMMRLREVMARARRSKTYKPQLEDQFPDEPWRWFVTHSGKPAPWQTDFEAMCEKTAVRAALTRGKALFGTVLDNALRMDDAFESSDSPDAILVKEIGESSMPVEPSTPYDPDVDWSQANAPATPQPQAGIDYEAAPTTPPSQGNHPLPDMPTDEEMVRIRQAEAERRAQRLAGQQGQPPPGPAHPTDQSAPPGLYS